MLIDRRTLFFRTAAVFAMQAAGAGLAFARGEPIELAWSDLVPEGSGVDMEALRSLGVIQHGQLSTPFDQETSAILTDKYDGALVRIPGYLVPLEFEGTGITTGLLVPYVGACIHVPPPPPNQLVFVTTTEPYELGGLFEAVYVTGTFGAAATTTQLAEVGYAVTDGLIEAYEW